MARVASYHQLTQIRFLNVNNLDQIIGSAIAHYPVTGFIKKKSVGGWQYACIPFTEIKLTTKEVDQLAVVLLHF